MDKRLKGFADYNGIDHQDMGTLILAASTSGEFTGSVFPDYLENLGIQEGNNPEDVVFKIRVKLAQLEQKMKALRDKNDDKWAGVEYEISIVEDVLRLIEETPEGEI